MVRLSGFADEIASELDEQLKVLEEEDIHYLELRGVWGKNVLDLSDAEVDRIKSALQAGGFGVSAIGSPIGKVGIEEPFDPHLEAFRRILDIAVKLESSYIRLFSFYIPQGRKPEEFRIAVLDRLQAFLEAAEGSGVVLLHENEKGIYGDTAERCRDLLTSINSFRFRAIFDPANFVQGKLRPFTDCYPLLKEYIEYCHIKDAMLADGRVVPAGEGDGQVRELLAELKKEGFEGFLSLEPHLAIAGASGGFSGPELFRKASNALKGILDELGVEYS